MGGQSEPRWKPHAVAAGVLILDALVLGVAPSGPWIDLWEKPEESARLVLYASIGFLTISWIAGNPMQPHLPDPTGLVLVLVGLLLGLQAVYVYLVIGPLKEE